MRRSSLAMIKRIFDVTISTFAALLSIPLMLAIGLLIKLESTGPAIISTQRVGKHGQHFAHYRFRTMAGSPPQKTRFGRFIGNLSLDDIPTLWNVIRGDMSLVGPRPEVPEKVDLDNPIWQKILSVRPGILGLGLVTFLDRYNQTPVTERIMPELYYVEHQSWWFDLQLILKSLYLWLKHGHLKGKV